MAEPIEMPFGLWARVSSRNHALDGGPDPLWAGAVSRGKGGHQNLAVFVFAK